MLCMSAVTQQMAVMVVWKVSTRGVNEYERERRIQQRVHNQEMIL